RKASPRRAVKERDGHAQALLGTALRHLRDELPTTRGAAHATARAEPEARPPRDVVHGVGPLLGDDVADLRLGDGLAGTHHRRLPWIAAHALDDAPTPRPMPVLEPRRRDRFHA